ncbi:FAD-binding oxidoreductase [Kitasatospora sp. NBC_01250]|uniref:FAD-binding oxidoreductase n=1 Tax=unclassified Kitasatospora TaxID=2633591 RepID=UPI002E1172FF|nr:MULTISPECIES: FAD-binding oxidoreductase [unclassified Kitasatospora]WSJ65327.1 FAD-binding oxidoreductase [Kitasatospora sp. NBC_01302]
MTQHTAPAPSPASPEPAARQELDRPERDRQAVDRRALLRLGAGAAAAAALTGCTGRAATGAGPVASTAPGPAHSPAHSPSTVPGSTPSSSAPAASAGPADWTALAKDLQGTLIRPGDTPYPAAARQYQPQFDGVRPGGVLYPANAQDAVTALAFAGRYGLPVALRSGGHNYGGWSAGPGLVLDVGRLNTVTASGGGATVGAGARLIDVYAGLAGQGVAIPAGSCPSVGVTGLTLGGGVGVTSRAYGLTCDSLTGAEVVTADGRILRADANSEPDLFWALRGGGGGNFGVVTSLDFRTSPAVDCSYAFLSWPWSSAAAVVRAWQAWAPTAPDQLWADLHLLAWPDGRLELSSTAVHLGPADELSNLIDRLGVQPSSAPVHSKSFLETMQVMGGVSGWTQAAAHLPGSLPGQNPQGRLTRESYAARSDFFTKALPDTGIAALVAAVADYARTAPQGGSAGVAFDALGGAVNRVAPGDTAFVHRDALFLAQYTANYPGTGAGSGPGVDQSRSWLNTLWSALRRYASGQAYQNYADPQLTDWEQAYYGANAPRLRQVKQQYDPRGTFHFPQSVPL